MYYQKRELASHNMGVSVMKQLLRALTSLHKQGVVHTAIQLNKLLISSLQPIHIKLTGFEFSVCGKESVQSQVPFCRAPEVWEKSYRSMVAPFIWEEALASRGYSKEKSLPLYGSPVDIWGAGVVCSQLVLGWVPCYLDKEKPTEEQVADYIDLLLAVQSESSTERSDAWAQKLGLSSRSVPPLLLNFLQKLLEPDPQSRAKAEDCLIDAWLPPNAQDLRDNVQVSRQEECVTKRRRLN